MGFKNPEDPVFYRDDGSVFFSSIIHDGKCFLFPTDSENISDIVSSDHWVHKNESTTKIADIKLFKEPPDSENL